jgi:D-glycero-alpha-D-manno-heptose-7-phosphate kinase
MRLEGISESLLDQLMMEKKKHIIVSSPYRISLGGGGTDLPFYASQKGGSLITAAIDEYITVLVAKRTLDKKIFLQYSTTEMVDSIDQVSHEILKEVLKYFKISESFQVATFSTMPAFTGLGASSTLIVGITKAINELNGRTISPIDLAKQAYHIEREILGLAGGFQDQYIAALGGVQILEISKELKVTAKSLEISDKSLKKLQAGLFLIHSGIERDSEKIINQQEKEINIIDSYNRIKAIGKSSVKYLIEGDIQKLGKAMDDHWKIKQSMSSLNSTLSIDQMYLDLKSFGAIGGKIIGAGGGGFFLMAVDKNKDFFIETAKRNNFHFVDFRFEFNGSHVVN